MSKSAKQSTEKAAHAALADASTPIVPHPDLAIEGLASGWEQTQVPLELLLSDGRAPSEFRMFKAGLNTSVKGDFIFDEQSAESVMAFYASRKLDLMMDYEHMSIVQPPIVAPASAKKFVPEVRDGELWATSIQWTDRARQMLEAGEYRYFSPAFKFDPKTMRIMYLINCALTNTPALDAVRPLMAASAAATTQQEDTTMAFKKMSCTGCKASLKSDEEKGEHDDMYCSACLSGAKEGAMGRKVLRTLGLSMEAGESAALSSVEGIAQLRTDVMALTATSTVPMALGVLEGWKKKADERDELVTKFAKLEQEKLSADFTAAVGKKLEEKCISPAQAEKFLASAKDDKGALVKDRVDQALGLLSTFSVPIASGSETPAPKGDAPTATLSADEIAMCAKTNRSPEEYAKWKAGALADGSLTAGLGR